MCGCGRVRLGAVLPNLSKLPRPRQSCQGSPGPLASRCTHRTGRPGRRARHAACCSTNRQLPCMTCPANAPTPSASICTHTPLLPTSARAGGRAGGCTTIAACSSCVRAVHALVPQRTIVRLSCGWPSPPLAPTLLPAVHGRTSDAPGDIAGSGSMKESVRPPPAGGVVAVAGRDAGLATPPRGCC